MKTKSIDSYRYFFPAGWALAVFGVALWILYPLNIVSYPGVLHPDVMMGGFFLCFVCGFLMTAIPQFLSVEGPTKMEQGISFILIFSLFVTLFIHSRTPFILTTSFLFIFLATFILRRFFKRETNLPDSFIFVGFGILSGLLGNITLTFSQFVDVPLPLYLLSKSFYLSAYIYCLVIGVGTRIIPALFGFKPLPNHKNPNEINTKMLTYIFLGIIFLGSYVVEVFVDKFFGNLLRSLVMILVCIPFWGLYKLPIKKGGLTLGLWSASWMMVLSQVALTFAPSHFRVHIIHIGLISGLSLITYMVATRVTLAHGHYGFDLEKTSKALYVSSALVILAGLTRFSAGIRPDLYESHLVYAASTFLVASLIWGAIFIPKAIKLKE